MLPFGDLVSGHRVEGIGRNSDGIAILAQDTWRPKRLDRDKPRHRRARVHDDVSSPARARVTSAARCVFASAMLTVGIGGLSP
jgi:hypothetical protein